MTGAERAALLRDALALWEVTARIEVDGEAVHIRRGDALFTVTTGPAPTRWFVASPGRRPRPAPSVVAMLAALRAALGVAEPGRLVGGLGAPIASAAAAAPAPPAPPTR